jgi:ACS family hexuronate transporter-like MFS transporter
MIQPEPKKIPGLRWYMAGMLCLASELNYLDRQTLSVLAQTIQDDLKISTTEYANITSAFLGSYAVMYAVSGRLVDWLGSRKSFLIFVTSWSVVNMLNAFARTATHFTIFRFMLGAAEPASFPAGIKASAEWFPLRERALAVGIFNAGTAAGSALAVPLISWIALTWNWRAAFVFGGVLGLLWVVVWALVYRLPREHSRLSAAELALIESDRIPGAAEPTPVPLRQLLGIRSVWGCVLARVLTDPISYFFFFWIPKFLQQERGFSLADIGKYSWIPFLAGAIGNVVGGALPRWLIGRGWSLNRGRKTVMFVASASMPLLCYLVTRVPDPGVAVALMTGMMFAHTLWLNVALPAEVLPPRVVGTVTGIGGCLGAAMGVITQQMIGWTVEHVSFTPVFAVCSVVHLTAFAGVCWLIGELGKIPEIPATGARAAV